MTIRLEVIAERQGGAWNSTEEDEARVVDHLKALCQQLHDSGFEVVSAALHGGSTYPAGLLQVVPAPEAVSHDAPSTSEGAGTTAY